MKAKKLLALVLALLTVVMLLVSCGGDSETEASAGETDPSVDIGGDKETEITDDLGDVNFADVENPVITFFVRTGFENEIYVKEIIDERLNDAVYWRNQAVQERLGVEIAQIVQACDWTSSGHFSEWNSTLRNAIQTTTHDFDTAMIYAGTGSSLAVEGCFLDLTELDMLSLEKPWWNQNLLREATIYNSLYFASGSISHSQLSWANVLWYNKDIYAEYFANSDKKDIYQVIWLTIKKKMKLFLKDHLFLLQIKKLLVCKNLYLI